MSFKPRTFNVPGRVIDFYAGGQAHHDYVQMLRNGETPTATREIGEDELALFNAVRAGKRIKAGNKGGYYVRAELSPAAVEALKYWAETLVTASEDGAREGDSYSRNDLRTAMRVLEALR